MQIHKSLGDFESAKAMYGKYSEVDEKFVRLREIVIANKKPRRLEVQGNLELTGNEIQIKSYEENYEGIVKSYFERYPLFDYEMYVLWKD